MEITYFFKGIIIGFLMAVPIGPIGIMCIRKTLTEGRGRGFIIGLGAATADMLYGCIAAFGLTVISNVLISQRIWMRLAGGALLLFLGSKRALWITPLLALGVSVWRHIDTHFHPISLPGLDMPGRLIEDALGMHPVGFLHEQEPAVLLDDRRDS